MLLMQPLDTTDLDAVLERAHYRHALHSSLGGRWSFDHWTIKTLTEQVNAGEISPYLLKRLTEEIPATVVDEDLAPLRAPTRDWGCRGTGWHHLGHDSDYPCDGCAGCRTQDAQIGWAISAFVWSLGTTAIRAELERTVVAMQCLANIGRAIASALSPGFAMSSMLRDTVAVWNEVTKGRWYKVTGKRGSAKQHYGVVGKVTWLGCLTGATGYGRTYHGTQRAGLKIEGQEKLVYVPVSTLDPIVPPAPPVAPVKQLLDWTGHMGEFVYVVAGPDAGKNGTVFWQGFSRGENRVGVQWGKDKEDVAWCAANQVTSSLNLATIEIANPSLAETALMVQHIDPAARMVLADSLEGRGYTELAAAWRGPTVGPFEPEVKSPTPTYRNRNRYHSTR